MSKPKAIALGNYADAKYHPFTDVDKQIEMIFQDSIDVKSTDDYSVLDKERLAGNELFISYTEFADEPLPASSTAALLSYVAEGEDYWRFIMVSLCNEIKNLVRCLVQDLLGILHLVLYLFKSASLSIQL